MNKVKDIDGKEVRGVYRSKNGALVVNDEILLSKYKTELIARQRDKETIETLRSEVDSLKDMVNKLIERLQ
jgi:hypothetical protein